MKFFISYKSDFAFVSDRVKSLVEQEVGEAMKRRVKRYKDILADTPIDQFEVREAPSVTMRAHDNTWIQVVVKYLVEPKTSSETKTRIFNNVMTELKQHPGKVILPQN